MSGRVIRGGRLIRNPGETDEEWASALDRFRQSRRWLKLYKMRDEIADLIYAMIGETEDVDDRRIADVRAVAAAVLAATATTSRADDPAVQAIVSRLQERLNSKE